MDAPNIHMKKVKLFCSDEYSVDDLGNVYSKKGKILKSALTSKGYCNVSLRIDGKQKTMAVHKVILKSFVPQPSEKHQVNHKDGNKQNNALSNLEWCTPKENIRHSLYVLNNIDKAHNHYQGKKAIIAIHASGWSKKFRSMSECARYLGCDRASVYKAISGINNSCKNCTFKWADGETVNA